MLYATLQPSPALGDIAADDTVIVSVDGVGIVLGKLTPLDRIPTTEVVSDQYQGRWSSCR